MLFDKIAFVLFYLKKYTYVLALEMVNPGNRHCASCIGTLSFPMSDARVISFKSYFRTHTHTTMRNRHTHISGRRLYLDHARVYK